MTLQRSHLAAAALAALVAVLGVQLARTAAESRRQAARIDALAGQARVWQQEALGGRAQADSLQRRLEGLAPHPIASLEIDALRQRGLRDPIADLVADLQRHPEIIPQPGVLGGRMGFYSTDRIRVLGERWVYAPFDDGHIAGDALLEFDVGRSGKITWKLLEWRMY